MEEVVGKRANQQHGISISYNTFEEALKYNKEIITNFKYKLQFNQNMNSVFSNIIVVQKEDLFYVIPFPVYSVFFESLFKIIKEKTIY